MTMKNWNSLNSLEESISEINKVKVSMDILMESEQLSCYRPAGMSEKYQTFLFDIHDRFNQAYHSLNDDFVNLWDELREESIKATGRSVVNKPNSEDDDDAVRWNHIVSSLRESMTTQSSDGNGTIPEIRLDALS